MLSFLISFHQQTNFFQKFITPTISNILVLCASGLGNSIHQIYNTDNIQYPCASDLGNSIHRRFVNYTTEFKLKNQEFNYFELNLKNV